jgi:hypothetical protein
MVPIGPHGPNKLCLCSLPAIRLAPLEVKSQGGSLWQQSSLCIVLPSRSSSSGLTTCGSVVTGWASSCSPCDQIKLVALGVSQGGPTRGPLVHFVEHSCTEMAQPHQLRVVLSRD